LFILNVSPVGHQARDLSKIKQIDFLHAFVRCCVLIAVFSFWSSRLRALSIRPLIKVVTLNSSLATGRCTNALSVIGAFITNGTKHYSLSSLNFALASKCPGANSTST
jgi:hypothetical protein